jgi:hypothetical protein
MARDIWRGSSFSAHQSRIHRLGLRISWRLPWIALLAPLATMLLRMDDCPFAAVVIDYHTPEISGYELA